MTCCCPKRPKYEPAAAQFSIVASPDNIERIPLTESWSYGRGIALSDSTTITLAPGRLYEITYVTIATPEAGNFYEIVPYINGTLRLLYAAMGTAGNNRNASTCAAFLIDEAANAEATISFSITYPETVRNIDLTGVISVSSHRIPPERRSGLVTP